MYLIETPTKRNPRFHQAGFGAPFFHFFIIFHSIRSCRCGAVRRIIIKRQNDSDGYKKHSILDILHQIKLTMAKSGGSAFTGGKLSLKGDKKKKSKKKSSKSKHSLGDEDSPHAKKASSNDRIEEKQQKHSSSSDEEEELTAAEKRSKSFKQKRERKEMEQIVSLSHRERVEAFNTKLGELTELNDIPRVSAAGNG